jgi:alpha-L-glutamate ligase-like protein/uncharacterized protein (TIGR02421 family)
MKFFERASGILGINARNLLYLGRYNSRADKKFADNKIFTKDYLSSRGLGVAKVFVILKDYNELKNFNPKNLPDSFVIKPNRGFGGEGILVIVEKKGNKFVDINGKEHAWDDLFLHLLSILDGKYAISGLKDEIIVEERLVAHDYFKNFVESGLPDVRIIVFNYVPIIAMLRIPTAESQGKANLHLGAVGVGINIGTGRATYGVQHNKFISKLPNGERISDIKLPDWDEILLLASRAQHVSQIGFLAVDLVLTTNGSKILELNARAGLRVQIANQIPLKSRLKKVVDLQVPNPEKGVEVSKTLFSSNIAKKDEQKEEKQERPVIGLYEYVNILNTKYDHALTKVDPHAEDVLVDQSMQSLDGDESFINIKLKDKRIKVPFKFADLRHEKYKVLLAGKYLQDFLIDINLKSIPESPAIKKKHKSDIEEKIIKNIDKKIFELSGQINVLSYVKPINLDQEKHNFLNNQVISPRFFYKEPKSDMEMLRRELKSLPTKFDHPLAKIYKKKIEEMKVMLDLSDAINTVDLQTISERLYGKADKILYDKAVNYIKDNPIEEDQSKILNFKIVVKQIEKFLKDNKLTKWKIKINPNQAADIAVNRNGSVLLKEGVEFSENRLKAVLLHEISTHVFRLENARLQKYKIFETGTAGYLETEEGLAAYNQKQLNIPMGEKDHWMAYRVIGSYLADEMSFVDLFHYMKEYYGLDDESAWKTCIRAKRGLIDTGKKISFTRDVVYFKGYLSVKDYLKKNPEIGLRNLYLGKIAINDFQFMGDLEEYKVKFLPDYDF